MWIDEGGLTTWHAKSPDVNPVDFYIWGHQQSVVYAIAVDSLKELQQVAAASHSYN
jgi:hypothetical protein